MASAVPKPSNAGKAQTAIANTRAAYVNIRNGPGTQYDDIGDLRNYTLVALYPPTRTGDGWVYVEQYGTSGWVSESVVTFNEISGTPPVPRQVPTPYDGKSAVWHWRGDSIGENSIDEIARNLKSYAPHVTSLFVKTSDYTASTGPQWMGYWDSKRSLAIDGPASIDKWVTTLAKYDIDFHAWAVPRGADPINEVNLIVQACLRPGVKSMILDVEPYAGFWMGGREGVRPYLTRIRRAIPGSFHIGMSIDPRASHYEDIFPQEWFPFVNSIHPQSYWNTFGRAVDDVLDETYHVWGSYGRPVIPALDGDADTTSMAAAFTLSTQVYKARGLSWWRMGTIGPAQFATISQPISLTSTPDVPTTPPPDQQYSDEQVVTPSDPGFNVFSYTGNQEVKSFAGTWGWQVYYKSTEDQASKVAARWLPGHIDSGKYEIATFVPARHSTTKNARFKIHGVKGAASELTVSVDQTKNRDSWVTLGVYDFDRSTINAGIVFLNDLTGEKGKELAFDAVRWRKIAASGSGYYADGFDVPMGTATERRSTKVWPGKWVDASPFAKLYFVGTPSQAYHTGADLNLPADADAHTPVYAPASGIVTFAARLPTWGNVIIIKHDPLKPGGTSVYSRLAHSENMIVTPGQRVTRGQQISHVGNAFGVYAYHLHFDISPTTILETNPENWPAKDLSFLLKNYVDPKLFILANRPRL